MNKNQSNNDSGRKRKKNRHKNKKWKRTKLQSTRIFQEPSFDSSDENEVVLINESPSKSSQDSFPHDLKKIANLTPSKSESENFEVTDIPEAETSGSVVFDDAKEYPCVLNYKRFDFDSDVDAQYYHNSVVEELCRYDGNTEAEIVSASILHSDEDVKIKKKLKKKKSKIVNRVLEDTPDVKKKSEAETASFVSASFFDSDEDVKTKKKLKKKKSKIVNHVSEDTPDVKKKSEAETESFVSASLLDSDEDVKIKKKLKKKIVKHVSEDTPVIKKKSEAETENFVVKNVFDKEAQCHYTNDGILVILEKNDRVYFHGLCQLSVLHGQVEVLGHILTKNSPEVKLYSPRGSSLLYLSNVTESDVPVTNYLLTSNISKRIKFTEKCAIILCKELNDPDIIFIEKHISQQILPKENPHFARIVFQPKEGQWNLLKGNEKWNNVIDEVGKNTKLMICGGKGVGKTTFLRYALNRLLMKFKEVRVIDLDPGQSEFTVPGCISVVRVDKPVFGVNFTHLQKTERSLLSNINIAYEPDKYISGVKYLLKTNLEEIPTLINYMGYTHGIGINILSAVIMCINPTDILQIYSQDSKKNYKFLLKTDVVKENAKLFVPSKSDLSYKLHQIESMCDQNDGWAAEPRQLREMCTLAYVSQVIRSESIFKSEAPMYRISLDDIIISDLKGEKLHPAAVNACLVALCALENDEEYMFVCFGWGIVRGIDSFNNEVVLLTNEKADILDKVSHLVSNGVNLPPSVYMTPNEVTGSMPYVIEGLLMSFGQIPKRSRMSVKSVK